MINVWANVLGWQQITNAMLQCAEGSFNDGLEWEEAADPSFVK